MESSQPGPLGPELKEAESTLEQALAEACAAEPASKIDTGELIRVEEVLAIASDAAKRAVSLRRRRRANPGRANAGGRRVQAALTEAETAASPAAARRVVTDARGVRWDVFSVYPEARPSPHSQLRGTFQHGWLCFDAGEEKRRLSPIPDDWQALTDVQLLQLVERAEVVPRRRGRSTRRSDPPAPPPPSEN